MSKKAFCPWLYTTRVLISGPASSQILVQFRHHSRLSLVDLLQNLEHYHVSLLRATFLTVHYMSDVINFGNWLGIPFNVLLHRKRIASLNYILVKVNPCFSISSSVNPFLAWMSALFVSEPRFFSIFDDLVVSCSVIR